MQGIADCQPSQFKCGALECIAIGNRKLYWSCGENCLRTSEQCQGTCPKGFSACGSSECWENHYFERYTHTVLWLLLRKLCLVNLPTPLKKAVLVLWRKMYQYLWEMQWNMPNRLLSLRVKPMQRGQQRVSIMWEKCISTYEQCNDTCPEGFFACGSSECLKDTEYYRKEYRTCEDKCIQRSKQCNGICPEGFFACGASQCIDHGDYRSCGDKCIHSSEQCNGACPKGYYTCGAQECVLNKKWYWTCGDKCIHASGQCSNGTCNEGFFACGNQCKEDNEINRRGYWTCGDRCFSTLHQCNGVCPEGSYACGANLCTEYDSGYRTCGDRCIKMSEKCDVEETWQFYAHSRSFQIYKG